jgi:uncharacterized protein
MGNKPILTEDGGEAGATVVITHRVREGGHAGYEAWLTRVTPVCMAYPGHMDWQIIRPVAGLTSTYTVVIRFDRREHLEAWMKSEDRRRLIAEVQPFLAKADDFYIRSGLDFWFTPEGAKAQMPVRWKQFLVTWSAIYPLVLGVSWLVVPAMRRAGLAEWPLVTTAVGTGITVFLMTYVVMPRYTKLLKRWLFA